MPGLAGRRAARRQVRAGRAAATAPGEFGGCGSVKPPVATNDLKAFAAVNDPALISKDDSGPSFPSVNALITAFDRATVGMSPASQETRRSRTGRQASSAVIYGIRHSDRSCRFHKSDLNAFNAANYAIHK